MKKSILAILLVVQQWRPYLQLREFAIKTEYKILTHLSDQRLHTEWKQKALTKLMGLQYTVQYRKGILNGVAYALSREPDDSSPLMAAIVLKPVWLDSYTDDSFVQTKMQQLAIDSSTDQHFTFADGLFH
jgi:hypothetical protein